MDNDAEIQSPNLMGSNTPCDAPPMPNVVRCDMKLDDYYDTTVFTPFFRIGTKTLILGNKGVCLAFVLRMALSAIRFKCLMRGWHSNEPLSAPSLFFASKDRSIADAELNIYHRKFIHFQDKRSDPQKTQPALPVPFYVDNSIRMEYGMSQLNSSLPEHSMIFIDLQIFNQTDDVFSFLDAHSEQLTSKSIILIGNPHTHIEYNSNPVDTILNLNRYTINNGHDYVEATVTSRLFKKHKFYFSIDNLLTSPDLCRYGDRRTAVNHRKMLPPLIETIIRARRDPNNTIPIKKLAEQLSVSVATINRVIRQYGLNKQCCTGRKRGRKPTYETHSFSDKKMAEASDINSNMMQDDATTAIPQTEIMKVSLKRYSESNSSTPTDFMQHSDATNQ